MAASVDKVYEFGDWRLDPTEHLLLRNGSAVPLGPKVFDTLLVLVENAGRLITKDEFMSRVWPDSFVEDLALTQNISQLRKVLGTGEAPVIETVPKKGYRFVLPVAATERTRSLDQQPRSSRLERGTAFV
jgi:DNA-binding winged helix-turn-helix (wHTH) protein